MNPVIKYILILLILLTWPLNICVSQCRQSILKVLRYYVPWKLFWIYRDFFGVQDLTKEIVGDSRVMYDDRIIIEGNFTRKFSTYEIEFLDDFVDLTVQNKMLPLGVKYLHRINNETHVITSSSPNIVSSHFHFTAPPPLLPPVLSAW